MVQLLLRRDPESPEDQWGAQLSFLLLGFWASGLEFGVWGLGGLALVNKLVTERPSTQLVGF